MPQGNAASQLLLLVPSMQQACVPIRSGSGTHLRCPGAKKMDCYQHLGTVLHDWPSPVAHDLHCRRHTVPDSKPNA